jgi:hypothetical protein
MYVKALVLFEHTEDPGILRVKSVSLLPKLVKKWILQAAALKRKQAKQAREDAGDAEARNDRRVRTQAFI